MRAMTPVVRKAALTAHVISSVGWLGAVGAFLVLSIAGLRSKDVTVVRSAYVSMNLIGLYSIVPMSLTSVATGVWMGLGTEWGLRRHYWVMVKLLASFFDTLVLLLHQFTAVAAAARSVSDATLVGLPGVGPVGIQLVADAGFGMAVLAGITYLSVFKPWGRTRFGQRLQHRRYDSFPSVISPRPAGLKVLIAFIVVVAAAFIASHLAGGGLARHTR
jgi:hypothetical protein